MGKDDDEAWRAIVDNYGDRVLDEGADPAPEVGYTSEPWPAEGDEQAPEETTVAYTWDSPFPDGDWNSDRFVPPPPPPLPTPTPDRGLAWAGVFGSPLILLGCLMLSISIPQLLAYALVAAFVGGFGYLVFNMPREPRDPDDDGAVV